RQPAVSDRGVHVALGRIDARCALHGHRHGHRAGDQQGTLDLRHRHRLSRCPDPVVERTARGRYVRHPADERDGSVHQEGNTAEDFRCSGREAREGGRGMSMATAGAAPVERKEVPSWRLLALMTSAGAIAGALIATVYQLTLPRIERHKSEVERAAVLEVLKAPASF